MQPCLPHPALRLLPALRLPAPVARPPARPAPSHGCCLPTCAFGPAALCVTNATMQTRGYMVSITGPAFHAPLCSRPPVPALLPSAPSGPLSPPEPSCPTPPPLDLPHLCHLSVPQLCLACTRLHPHLQSGKNGRGRQRSCKVHKISKSKCKVRVLIVRLRSLCSCQQDTSRYFPPTESPRMLNP